MESWGRSRSSDELLDSEDGSCLGSEVRNHPTCDVGVRSQGNGSGREEVLYLTTVRPNGEAVPLLIATQTVFGLVGSVQSKCQKWILDPTFLKGNWDRR
jgi:hypothetical protein